MPSLSDLTITLETGQRNLDLTGPLVNRDTTNSRQTRYRYTWVNPGTSTTASTPIFGTLQPGAAPNLGNRLRGNAPTTETFRLLDCIATPDGSQPPRHTPDDAGVRYRARVTFRSISPPPAVVGSLVTGFNNLDFRDSDRFYQGVVHDNPYAMYLFMGLPLSAPSTAGPVIRIGTQNRRWLPIENIQQFIAPAVTSENLPGEILRGPNIGDDAAANQVPTVAKANNRISITYGAASLRVLWNEEYASHGGPYGLYQASINMGLSVPWVYYQRDFDRPTNGKIIRAWTGYVGELRDTLTRQGRVIDAFIYPDSAPVFGDIDPVPGLTSVRSIVWPRGSGRQ